MRDRIKSIAQQFDIPGRLLDAQPHGGGHIHDSFCLTYDEDGQPRRYLLQRINESVFADPPAVMDNIRRIGDHIRSKFEAEGLGDAHRRTLTVVPAREGLPYHRDDDGKFWRVYVFIEGTISRETLDGPEQAYAAARTFGHFQKMLADLPSPPLAVTIPHFHDTPKRLTDFQQIVAMDPQNRVGSVSQEIECIRSSSAIAGLLYAAAERGEVAERIVLNDAKPGNILLDEATQEGLCVIDLDTTMLGLVLNDFGDMVRTMVCTADEDQRDLSKVGVSMPMFDALVRGYLDGAGDLLQETEKALLVTAGKVITFEQAVRYLGDYLAGDTYYKTDHPEHNLDRCRTQLKLVQSIIENEEEMAACVERAH